MENIIASLDRIADLVQASGLTKQASSLDAVANIIDRSITASLNDLARARLFKQYGMALYVDMDGVLTDFERQYKDAGGKSLKDIDWELTDTTDFWKDMPWKKDGKALWKALSPFDPIILSAPTKDQNCRVGKREWVRRELGEHTRLILDPMKWKYASPVAVLVDDMTKNTAAWETYGGIAIKHESTGKTLKDFRKVVDEKVKELAE
jgi:hypothetical protein